MATPSPLVADLTTSRARFRCTGPDALRYLNGQLTQDVRLVTPEHALPACVTTAKGKMEGELVIASWDDGFLIDAPAELAESIAARLDKYLIADDCVIEPEASLAAHFHLLGLASLPPTISQCLPAGTRHHRAWRFGSVGTDLLIAATTVPPDLPIASDEEINDRRIVIGCPAWGAELGENVLPPEALLDHTHISYTKGCYTGQETISRLKSVGRTTRLLCKVASDTGRLSSGMALSTTDDNTGKPAGHLTSATRDGHLALAWVRRSQAHEAAEFRCTSPESGESIAVTVHMIRPAPAR